MSVCLLCSPYLPMVGDRAKVVVTLGVKYPEVVAIAAGAALISFVVVGGLGEVVVGG